MKRKIRVMIALTIVLLLMSMALISNVPLIKANGTTIYIRADGSVDPSTAPIQRNGDIYALTGNISISSDADGIVIERNNIVVDGAGYTVQGIGATGQSKGIRVSWRSNITIKNTKITGFQYGIYTYPSLVSSILLGNTITNNDIAVWHSLSSYNTISGNNITNNGFGLEIYTSSYNTISGNNITNSMVAIELIDNSSDNIISENSLASNGWGVGLIRCLSNNTVFLNNIINSSMYGIYLGQSSGNFIFHNNFVNNARQVFDSSSNLEVSPSINEWDDGYPSGGNYWSDYTGVDEFSGPNQDQPSRDGIGDTPYVIDVNNQDRYPLMVPWKVIPAYDWSMFRHDARHSAFSNSEAPNTNSTVWTYGPCGYFAVADGMAFIVSGSTIRALNVTTAQLIWSTETSFTTGGIAVGYSAVFVQDWNGVLYALDEYSGALKWSFTVGTVGRPTVADGIVFASTREQGTVYAVNATTGALKWSRSPGLGYTIYSNPAIDSGMVFVATWTEGKVYALNESTGSTIWSSVALTSLLEASPVIVGDKIYMGGGDGMIYVLDKNTGTRIRTYGPVRGYLNEGPVVAYGKLFVATDDSDRTVYAIDETTGAIIWSYYIGGDGGAIAGPNVADNKVFVGSNTFPSRFFAFNESTGELIWSYSTSTAGYTSDLIIANDMAFGSIGDTLYAFKQVSIPGDLNGDLRVSLVDLVLLATAYGSRPGDLNWNPNADIDGNGVVGLIDLVILAQNYGRTYP